MLIGRRYLNPAVSGNAGHACLHINAFQAFAWQGIHRGVPHSGKSKYIIPRTPCLASYLKISSDSSPSDTTRKQIGLKAWTRYLTMTLHWSDYRQIIWLLSSPSPPWRSHFLIMKVPSAPSQNGRMARPDFLKCIVDKHLARLNAVRLRGQ